MRTPFTAATTCVGSRRLHVRYGGPEPWLSLAAAAPVPCVLTFRRACVAVSRKPLPPATN